MFARVRLGIEGSRDNAGMHVVESAGAPGTPPLTSGAAEDWQSIDWSSPWLESLRAIGEPLAQQVLQGRAVHEVLNAARPVVLQSIGLRFVPQGELPEGTAYEAFIAHQRCVPTRHNFHDFFNGLVWLHWPQFKLHMNRLQSGEIGRSGVGAQRGPLRDALTVLDENGALWWAPQPLIDALRARQWQRLMVELRPLWQHCRLLPVGHALLEKLVQPRKPITAHLLCFPLAAQDSLPPVAACPPLWDGAVAQHPALQGDSLQAKPFAPLPVLGVPGWWPENANFSFYDDSYVFRGQRPTTTTTTPGPAEVTAA